MGTSASFPRDRPRNDRDVIARAVSLLRGHLPPGWSAEEVASEGPDAVVELAGPGRTAATLTLEVKLTPTASSLPRMLRQALDRAGMISARAKPVLVARYLSPDARETLDRQGVSYIDATGNLRVVLDRPALFLHDRGADRDPWRGPGRPAATLNGEPAALITRALVDFTPPITVPALAQRSGTSLGATYRVIDLLDQEGLLEREPRKAITSVRWRALIERWSRDYGFQRSNSVRLFLSPRGLRPVKEDLAGISDLQYAVTGSLAAEPFAPYAPPRLAMVYAEEPEVLATRLDLSPVDSNGNVLIAKSSYSAAFQRLTETDGVRFVAPSQAAVDLLTAPGRGPAEGEALLDWMEANEAEWRG